MTTRKLISTILIVLGQGFAVGWTMCKIYPNLNPAYLFVLLVLVGFLIDTK